jgi:hypothetical protein
MLKIVNGILFFNADAVFNLINKTIMKRKLRTANDISPDHFTQILRRGLSTLLALCAFQYLAIAQAPTCSSYGDGDATNIVYTVNGSVVSDFNGVSSGDQVSVCFDVTSGSTPTIFTLVSYKAPGSSFNAADADLQTIFDMQSQTVSGSGCLSVTVPSCYFQLDFVRGCAITQFGTSGSSNFYGAQGRLIAGKNGGAGTCGCVATADAGADLSLLCNSTSATINASTYTHSPVISWQAMGGGNITAGAGTLNPTINASGTYVLTVTDTLNCSVADTVVVTGHTNVLTAGVIGNEQSNCGPFVPAPLISVADATANPGETIAYLWLQSPVNVLNTPGNPYWSAIPGATGASYTPGLISTTTYFVRCSRTIGCTFLGPATETNIIGVTILPQVNVDLGSDVSIAGCAGGSATLDAGNSGLNFLWNTGATSQTINASASGMYYVTVTNADGCSDADSVNVAGGGSLTVDLGADVTLCAGASMSLDAGNAGASFSWSTGASTQMINVTSSGTYYVTVSNGSCTASDSIHVTVLPALSVNLGADINVTTCAGNITLDAGSSGTGFMWSTGASTQTISVSASGAYYVTVSNGTCSMNDTINVTVNPGSLSVNLGADVTVCAGGSVMLDAGNAGMGFSWSTGASTEMISVNTSGSVYVTVTNGSCSATDTVNVTVLPALNVDLGADISASVCAGPVMLDAGNTGMIYLWSTGSVSQTAGVTASGMYSVTVTNAGGCMASDSINVTFTPPTISVDLGVDAIVCAGSSLMLDAGNSGSAFSWNTGAGTQTISVNASGTYYVTVTNGSCSVSDSINVVVLPMMNVDLGNDTTVVFCAGSMTINAGNPGMTYLWNTGAVSQTISASASGTYYVTVTNVGGCTATDSINITVNPGTLSINIGNDTSYMTCTHETLTLDAGVTGGVYAWSTGLTTQTLDVSASGTYYVSVTNALGCIASDTINVNIIDNTVDLNLGSDTIVCGCLSLNAAVSGATSYAWCSGQTYPGITVCNTGVYCVTVGNGTCMSSDTITVTMNTAPVVHLGMDTTVVGAGATVTLNAGNAGMSYMWSTGATTQTILVTASGSYYVTVTDVYGCTGTDTITVNFPIGIAENTMGDFHADVFPNPSTGSDVTLSFSVAESENVEIRIMNVLGRVIYTENLQNFKGVYNKKLPMDELAGGIYFANVQKGKATSIAKFTVH